MSIFIRTIPNVMRHFGCSADNAQRYIDLRDEGYGTEQAALMAGLSDPPSDADSAPTQPKTRMTVGEQSNELRRFRAYAKKRRMDLDRCRNEPSEFLWSETQTAWEAWMARAVSPPHPDVAQRPIQPQGAASPQGAIPDAEAAKPLASSERDGPASAALAASLPALLLQAVEALENAKELLLDYSPHSRTAEKAGEVAAALRQRIGRE